MRSTRSVVLVSLVCAVPLFAACGGDSAPTNPGPAAPTSRVIGQGTFNLPAPTAEEAYFVVAPVTDSASGRWEATVDWAISTNFLPMWVADSACTVERFAKDECPFEAACECQFALRSETATPKPRVLTLSNAPGGTRTLIVMNMGPREEAVSYRVTLTSPGSETGEGFSPQRAGGVVQGRKRLAP